MEWTVLVNRRAEHGLYPADRPAPGGWVPAGFTGSEVECRSWLDAGGPATPAPGGDR
jgi:MbtH protein